MSARFRLLSLGVRPQLLSSRRLYSASANKAQNYYLFLALGNPTPEYSGTRHNVGHWALQAILNHKLLTGFTPFEASRPLGIEASLKTPENNVLLAKATQTYMNMSGHTVSKVWQRFQKQHSNGLCHLVILHDELEVALGKVQVRRRKTSARGHNGLRSIDKCMGNDYTKIGIGVGKPARGSIADHVLSKFTANELRVLENDSLPRIYEQMHAMLGGDYINESR